MTYRQLILAHHFLHRSPFYPTPKILRFTLLFSGPKVPIPGLGAIYTPCNTFPRITQLRIPNCISIGMAVFAQLTAYSPYTLQCVLKSYSCATKKLIAAIGVIKKLIVRQPWQGFMGKCSSMLQYVYSAHVNTARREMTWETRSCCVNTSKHSSRLSADRCWLSDLTCLTLASSTGVKFTLLRDIHLHNRHSHQNSTAQLRHVTNHNSTATGKNKLRGIWQNQVSHRLLHSSHPHVYTL